MPCLPRPCPWPLPPALPLARKSATHQISLATWSISRKSWLTSTIPPLYLGGGGVRGRGKGKQQVQAGHGQGKEVSQGEVRTMTSWWRQRCSQAGSAPAARRPLRGVIEHQMTLLDDYGPHHDYTV